MRVLSVLLVVASIVVGCGPPATPTPSSADLATAIVVQLATDVALKASETPVPPTSIVASASATAVVSAATPFPPSSTATAMATSVPTTVEAVSPTTPAPTRGPTRGPTGAPTTARSPVAASSYVARASVSNTMPRVGSTVTVYGRLLDATGKGVPGVMMHSVWNYGTTAATCDEGPTDATGLTSCSSHVRPVAPGHAVAIGVSFTVKGQTYRAQTSFTPQ